MDRDIEAMGGASRGAEAAATGSKQAADEAAASKKAAEQQKAEQQTAATQAQQAGNLGYVMWSVQTSLAGLYFTMTSFAPQVLVVQMNQQSNELSRIASMAQHACAGSQSMLNVEESQKETAISETQQQAQALYAAGQTMNSMMISMLQINVSILNMSAKSMVS